MFISWVRKLFPRSTRTLRRPAVAARRTFKASFRPGVDNLEDRTVPAFLAPASMPTGVNPAGIAVGDFNGDGKADMAVVNQTFTLNNAGSVSILLSNGDGTFQPKIDYGTLNNAVDAAAGDFNGDGKLDLAVSGLGSMSILLGNGDGTFAAPTTYASGGGLSVKVGDFNNDGKLDIGTVASGGASVLLGNGDGTFQAFKELVIPGNVTNLVVGDFNHDGNLDMATSNTVSIGTITEMTGRGDGTFNAPTSIYAYSAPVYLATGDFNHDGYQDFAVTNSYAATSMSIVMNNGDGTYAQPVTYNIPETGYEIEVADFNNDGNDDFAVRGANEYMVGLGQGNGSFFAPVTYATPLGRFEAGAIGDFNGDGAVDFAYPSGAGVTVLMNANDNVTNLAGAVGFQVNTPAATTAGAALPMTVTAVDANGAPATGFLGTVFVTTNDTAAKGFAYTFTAADAGTHTFNSMRLMTVGDHTITVASPLMTSSTSTVTVTPAVSRFSVAVPTASTAGDTVNVTVSALNSLGAIGTSYTSTVHFTSSDIQAGLPADYTFTAADAGVHTFTVTLKSAGSQFISVTEVGSTAVTGGSFVNVSAAAVSSLSLAGAGGAIGIARPVTVVGRDIFGNIATSYSGIVHFTSSDRLAVLPADTTLTNGSATTNVTFLTVGTQMLTATDVATGLTGTMSSDATPPVAALFAVTGFPSTVAGVAQSFKITVRDTIGQVATGYNGTIYFTSSDMQAGLPASYTFTAADAGVHTFSATLRTAGTQSIRVFDSTGALSGSQVGIAVTPAAFTSFRVSVPNPTDSHGHILLTAGDVVSMTVKAVDAFGNAVVGYKGKVKFSSTDTQAGLPADYNFTAADAGVHVFNVVLKTATPNAVVWSVSVVDSANAATLATVTNFEVTNAAAASFSIAVPTNITAGTPFGLKVTVLDAYGNKVKNYFGTIHFGDTASLLGLPADYTFSSLDAGVASINVTLNTAGNQTLSVTDTTNPLLKASSVVSVKAAATTTTPPATGGGGGGGGGTATGGGATGGGTGGGGGKKVVV